MIAIDRDLLDNAVSLAGAVLIFIPAILVAMHQTRVVGRKVDEASGKAETAADKAAEVAEKADTGNSRPLGETVHDTAQTVEIVAAMMHTNTKELVALSNKLDEHIIESTAVHERLLNELDLRDRRKEDRDAG